jgi:hypothetical protein
VANFAASINEVVEMLDVLCYNGWFRIDDSQTASWGAIGTSQTPNWTNINDAQTPSWGVIDTKQPCS